MAIARFFNAGDPFVKFLLLNLGDVQRQVHDLDRGRQALILQRGPAVFLYKLSSVRDSTVFCLRPSAFIDHGTALLSSNRFMREVRALGFL